MLVLSFSYGGRFNVCSVLCFHIYTVLWWREGGDGAVGRGIEEGTWGEVFTVILCKSCVMF
jgi:hypothetical protein